MSQTSTFQETKEQIEQKMLLKLMSKLEDEPQVSQRLLASELGVALGLMNAYLKRCIKKGWVRASQVPAKRLAYFLTPEGFKEKSRMVKDYIASSLTFFRDARAQCENAFLECRQKGWSRIVLVGAGDLAEIARLVANSLQLKVDFLSMTQSFHVKDQSIFVVDIQNDDVFIPYDAILITDIEQPQAIYDQLKTMIPETRILTPGLLHISRNNYHTDIKHEETGEKHSTRDLDPADSAIEVVGA